jgi:uncharacterized membrane protein YeiB
LRGLALFGVLAINLETEFRVSIFRQLLPSAPYPGWDGIVDAALNLFVDMKAFALFSFLFGVGLAIQFDRLATSSRRTSLLVRRLLVLLLFGLIHLVLIWNADILTEYALAGFVVLPFLFAPRWIILASGYAALVIAVAQTSIGTKLLRWAEPVGRMAFTNYIMQSIVLGFIFYGYGLGLFGKLGSMTGLLLVLGIYAAQIVMSRLWLAHFAYGPIEWLWRALMYGHAPAFRKARLRFSSPTSV